MPGWGEPCLWLGDMWPAGAMPAGDMWPAGPGDIEWTGDMAGEVVCGGRPSEVGLKGFSSWILGDMCGCGDWAGNPGWPTGLGDILGCGDWAGCGEWLGWGEWLGCGDWLGGFIGLGDGSGLVVGSMGEVMLAGLWIWPGPIGPGEVTLKLPGLG